MSVAPDAMADAAAVVASLPTDCVVFANIGLEALKLFVARARHRALVSRVVTHVLHSPFLVVGNGDPSMLTR